MTLPKRNNEQVKMISVRLDSDLKQKQEDLSNANINVSQIIRDSIESAWCEMNNTYKDWNN